MLTWRGFYIVYYVYRCLCSVIGQLVVVQFTSLGDSIRYTGGTERFDTVQGTFWFLNSTALTEAIGSVFAALLGGNRLTISIAFQTLAFIGIYRFLTALPEDLRKWVAIILLAPSFNIWSSIASKEAVVVFAVGTVCAYLVGVYRQTQRLRLIDLIAVGLLAIYKAHYLVALGFVFAGLHLGRLVRQPELLVLGAGVATLIPLYLLRDTIDAYAPQIVIHFFSGAGASTRDAFWTDQYDVFWRAPYGFWLSFVGPTLDEAVNNRLQLAALAESLILVAILGLYLLLNFYRMPLFGFLMSWSAVFWLLFANYPFGVMNPGSAVRYRTGYMIPLLAILIVLSSREAFVRWRGKRGRPEVRSRPSRFGPRLVFYPKIRVRQGSIQRASS